MPKSKPQRNIQYNIYIYIFRHADDADDFAVVSVGWWWPRIDAAVFSSSCSIILKSSARCLFDCVCMRVLLDQIILNVTTHTLVGWPGWLRLRGCIKNWSHRRFGSLISITSRRISALYCLLSPPHTAWRCYTRIFDEHESFARHRPSEQRGVSSRSRISHHKATHQKYRAL